MIRTAAPQDAEAIAQVHILSWKQAYRGVLPEAFLANLSLLQRQSYWADMIIKGLSEVLVAETEDKIVGFSSFGLCRNVSSQGCHYLLRAFYLSPKHWDQGFGRALWLASRDMMRSKGAEQISLWVLAGNDRAINFYKVAGFQEDIGSLKPIELGGTQHFEVRYVLQLHDDE